MRVALQKLVWKRALSICEYCQMPQEYDVLPFEIEHVIAKQHGGQSRSANLALACFACNRHKGPNLAGIDPDHYEAPNANTPEVAPGCFCFSGIVR
jgi:5-methylcytosine-specific restriction endonuclease McrA